MTSPLAPIRRCLLIAAFLVLSAASRSLAQAPTVTTGPAQWLTSATTTLTGTVNPNGFATTVQFEYGPTTAYGTVKTVTLSPNSGSTALNVSAELGTLPVGTTYHYRLTATNASGPTPGVDRMFITARTLGDYQYTTSDGNATITGYTGAGGVVSIPGTVNGLAVTGIGYQAFYNKTAITSVVIPNGVTSIGSYAFYSCTGLTSVALPASVTSIGSYAFYSCTGLTSVTIPASVASIGSNPFARCTGLTAITVDAANASYSSLDGVLFNKALTALIQYPSGKAGTYTLAASITSIGSSAFQSCAGLTSVTIPASVATIGSYAFQSCTGLAAITVDAANASYRSLDGVLFNKSLTTLIQYPGGKVGTYTLPTSVTGIGSYAFSDCSRLTSVTLPASVTSIGSYAFQSCTGLAAITVDAANASYRSLDGVLFNKTLTILIQYPGGKTGAYTLPASVTSIGSYAFYSCIGLTSVTLPANVTGIGSYAFSSCGGLKTASYLGNAPTMGSFVFSGTAAGFTVYYLSGKSGFTSPIWQGYPAVALNPGIVTHPASVTITTGATATLAVTASGTAPFAYQWYQGASGTTTTPVGTNSASFTTSALTENRDYWVRVSNSKGSQNSNTATVRINLLVNGSFEQGPTDIGRFFTLYAPDSSTLPGWTVAANTVEIDSSLAWGTTDGTRSIDLNGNNPGELWQEVAGLVPGDTYRLDFDLSGNPTNASDLVKDLRVAVAGVTTDFQFDTSPYFWSGSFPLAAMGWIRKGVTFTAQNERERIQFISMDPVASGAGPVVDNVTLVLVEPPLLWNFGLAGYLAAPQDTQLTWWLPPTFDLAALAPTFSLSDGASAEPPSGTVFNFTSPQSYVVRSADGLVSKLYQVTATRIPTWATDAGGAWGDAGRWVNGTVGSGALVPADFGAVDLTADRTVSLDSPRTLNRLIFGDTNSATAGAWILNNNGNSANVLTMAESSPMIVVNLLGDAKVATISAALNGYQGLTKAGPGTLRLAGTNTNTGVTTLSGGVLSVGTIGNGGVAGNLGQGTNASANLVLDGGTLQYTGATASTNRGMTLNNVNDSGIEVTVSASVLTVSGALLGTGGFTKTGSGTLSLTGSNTYTGRTTVAAGTLRVRNSGLPAGSDLTLAGGALDLAGGSTTAKSLTVTGADAVIDFGSASTNNSLRFTNGATTGWTGDLIVRNFNPATDTLYFGGSAAGIADNISRIRLDNPAGYPAGSYSLVAGGNGSVALAESSSGDYHYTHNGTTATITGYSGLGGELFIPEQLDGLPVVWIGARAFQNNVTVTGVTLPTSVTSIGDAAFYACTGLASVTLPASVTSIGDAAFYACTGLASVTIPASVTSIGSNAFGGCIGLTAMTVDEANASYSSLDGVLFNKALTTLIQYPGGKAGAYTLPASVTSIGSSAFSSCAGLTSVILPASVSSIGSSAFSSCSGLGSAGFLGNAPTLGGSAFASTAAGFKVYFISGATGFTTPLWQGYPGAAAVASDPGILTHPASPTIHSGFPAMLAVTAFGTAPFTYQWFQGASGTTTTPMGSDSATFTTPALTTATSYWVKVTNAANPTGVNSATTTVSVVPPALVATGPASVDTRAAVTLTGTVNPNGLATTARFEYGTTTAYGSTAIVTLSPNNGSTLQNVSVTLWTLAAGTAYHYRLSATNAGGTTPGADRVFATERTAGEYKYTTANTTATITGYTGAGGTVGVPNYINGLAVIGVGYHAFYNTLGLTSLTIPAGVTSLGEGAFAGCTGLTSVTIPASVTGIGKEAFAGCAGLTSVTLPPTLTEIGSSVFDGCTGLTGITIPADVTRIGDYAFFGCTGLTEITIPTGVASIGRGSFAGCTGLTSVTIPMGVTAIESSLFEGCTGLISVSLPTSVTSIGESVFSGSTGLTSVAIPAGVTGIASYLFESCTSLTSVSLPPSVTSIGDSAFAGCAGLAGVTIPTSITNIGDSAFAGCTGLTGVSIPAGVTSLGSSAFAGCTGLTSVAIPAGVTGIASYLFDGCTGLTSVNLPDNVTSIGDFAFWGCTGLTGITLPTSVISIGASSFAGCTGLTGVIIPTGVASLGSSVFSGCTGLTGITIPATVTSLGEFVFYGCTGLTGFSIPASVTSIGIYAFSGCTGLTGITIPTSVISIGSLAFSGCTGLTSLTIPASVTSIGNSAFLGCTSLTNITVAEANTQYSGIDGVLFNQTQTTLIQCPAGKTGTLSIPGTVTGIASGAFSGCSGLTAIAVAADNTQYSDMDGVLFNRDETALIRFPTGRTGSYMVPNGVTIIEDSAFSGCPGLSSVTIPNSVVRIGNAVFSGCSGLTAISVGAGNLAYSSLDGVLFNQGQTLLLHFPEGKTGAYRIPANVTHIDPWAFAGCKGLVGVTIPASVGHVGYWAFSGCTSLDRVVFLGNAPTMDYGVFDFAAAGFTVYYFDGRTGFSSPTWEGYPAVNLGSPAPVVTTGNASGITTSAATLQGTVNPRGFATTARFEYGPTTAYGRTASVTLSPADGAVAQQVSVNITGLQLGQIYHYRLTATNSEGTSPGAGLTFATAVPFTYTNADGAITITGYTGSDAEVNIPGMIYGLPVTRIGGFAFHNNSGVTRVTLPASVTVIEEFAFASCGNLMALTLPIGLAHIGDFAFYECGSLANLILPGSVISIGNYAFAECGKLTWVTFNDGLTTIGAGAFYSCDKLTHVTIPSSVTGLGESAFENCTRLANATFMGNAPGRGARVFEATAAGFAVHRFDGAAGFAAPAWQDQPAVNMGAATPVVSWLIEQSLPYNTNLLKDANVDGVSLLMAYALDLDPRLNLSGSLPQPVTNATGMSLTFHAGAAGVTYVVESSDDLQTWSAVDVTLFLPDADGHRTATVPLSSPHRYLRLVVSVP